MEKEYITDEDIKYLSLRGQDLLLEFMDYYNIYSLKEATVKMFEDFCEIRGL